MERAAGDQPMVVWVWCGYYCMCVQIPSTGVSSTRAEPILVYPRLRWPERFARRKRRIWTEDQLPWGEPPTFPLAR